MIKVSLLVPFSFVQVLFASFLCRFGAATFYRIKVFITLLIHFLLLLFVIHFLILWFITLLYPSVMPFMIPRSVIVMVNTFLALIKISLIELANDRAEVSEFLVETMALVIGQFGPLHWL